MQNRTRGKAIGLSVAICGLVPLALRQAVANEL